MAYFSSTDDIKYVALFDNLSRRNIHTVRRPRTRTNGTMMVIEGSIRNYDGRISTFEVTEDDRNGIDIHFDMEKELHLLHEQMTRSRTGRILLAVAWCTKQMSMFFHKYPEVCSWEVTNDTNAERRGLMIDCN